MDTSCECKKDGPCDCGASCTQTVCAPLGEQSFAAVSGVPVVTAKAGDSGRIARISGKTETRRHMCELGFTIGEIITIVNDVSGNMIVEVRGSRIAIDRTLASKIFFAPE